MRLVVDFAIGTILELLALALVDRQFNRLAWRRFQHELRWLGTSDDTHLLTPQVASQFVALPGEEGSYASHAVSTSQFNKATDFVNLCVKEPPLCWRQTQHKRGHRKTRGKTHTNTHTYQTDEVPKSADEARHPEPVPVKKYIEPAPEYDCCGERVRVGMWP